MILQFSVDTEKYDLDYHEILLSTTEYIYRNTILVMQTISRGLNCRVHQSLQKVGIEDSPDQVLYYLSGSSDSKCVQISRSDFNNKLNEFRHKDFVTVKEVCEQYNYLDKDGNPASAFIAIERKNNEAAMAKIEFNSSAESENFVLPEWLSPAE